MTTSIAATNIDPSADQASETLSTLYHVSARGLVAGCALLAGGDVIRVIAGADPASPLLAAGWFLQAVGAMLAVLGLPALANRISRSAGVVGVAGLIGLTAFLFVFGIFGGLLHALAVPGLLKQGAHRPMPVDLAFLVAAILALIGSVAFSLGVLRARLIGRGQAALMIAGGVALFVGHPVGMHAEDLGLLMLMAGLGWSGFDLGRRPSLT